MRLQTRNFLPAVKRTGVHTLELNFAGQRYQLTESEARTLATDLLKLADPQGD